MSVRFTLDFKTTPLDLPLLSAHTLSCTNTNADCGQNTATQGRERMHTGVRSPECHNGRLRGDFWSCR